MWTFLLPCPVTVTICKETPNTVMLAYRSSAKKARSVNRLIKFIKNKCLERVQPSLSIEVLPSTSFTLSLPPKPKPILSLLRPTLTNFPPEISLSTGNLSQCMPTYLSPSLSTNTFQLPRSLKDVSLTTQPPPRSAILPNRQTYCTNCHKIFATIEDEKYHQEMQYEREDAYLLRIMLP